MEWMDEEKNYAYTTMDLGKHKYKQMIAQTGFTKEVLTELT